MNQRTSASLLVVLGIAAGLAGWLAGCAGPAGNHEAHEEEEGWAVTSWAERYEIFAECEPLAVGRVAHSHTHVTVLRDFSALDTGVVSVVLRATGEPEIVFPQPKILRRGIFSIEIKPERAGEYDLFFRVEAPSGNEEIPSGRVRVAPADSVGGLIVHPSIMADGSPAPTRAGEPISFLKEQQWRIPFATAWARMGSLPTGVRGTAVVRPAAGGEALLTAPLDGRVASDGGAHVGRAVAGGSTVFAIAPRGSGERSLAAINSELALARTRLARLEQLLAAEAVSPVAVEEMRVRTATLQAERDALDGRGGAIAVRAPFAGELAELFVVPGQAVAAGDPLARLVRSRPVWLDVALRPVDAASLASRPTGLVLEPGGGLEPIRLDADAMRLVALSPELRASTGLGSALFEIKGGLPLRIGTTVETEVLLATTQAGIVVPREAVLDDGGVPVVYVQLDGEGFHREEVTVLARQGDLVLVAGAIEGGRIVTRGAAAIRRASQLSSGAPAAHVH